MGEIRTAYDSDIFQSGVDTGQDEQVWGQVEPTNALAKILAETASADIRSTDLKDEKKTIAISNNFVVGVEQGSRLAHKISRICIAQLSPYDNDLPLTKITSDDMMHMGYTRERLTAHMNEVLDEILNYRIKLSVMRRIQKDSQMTGINVFAQATVIPGEGAILVQLNPVLKEHFLNLSQDFTSYEMQVAMQMPSMAASKLHELLICRSRQYCADYIQFDVEDLAAFLGYKPRPPKEKEGENTKTLAPRKFNGSDFVNSTIKRAVNTINEISECFVKYETVKTGRQVTGVRFYVESNWKNRAEKAQFMKWREERMTGDEEARTLMQKADAEIVANLKSGKDCICTEQIEEIKRKTGRRVAPAV